MYINRDFRSITQNKNTTIHTKKKKNLGIIIYIKGREIWDMVKPILPWLGFVQIDSNFIRENLNKLALWFVHTIFN